MLQFAPGMKVYLALKPVDMRRGFDGLAADVAQVLRNDLFLARPSCSEASAAIT